MNTVSVFMADINLNINPEKILAIMGSGLKVRKCLVHLMGQMFFNVRECMCPSALLIDTLYIHKHLGEIT